MDCWSRPRRRLPVEDEVPGGRPFNQWQGAVAGPYESQHVLSMLLAFGVYWTAWGMWFALGLVLSIYVHEMGHVVALRRYGIAATAMPHSASPGSPLVTGSSPCWRSLPRYVRSIQPCLT